MAKKDSVSVPRIKGKTKDGKEVNYRIKEITNGIIITQSFEWKDKKGQHQWEEKEYFVKEDPIKKEADNMFTIMEGAVNDTESSF
jgi:hypothetical protein